jgi:hypothetical protein
MATDGKTRKLFLRKGVEILSAFIRQHPSAIKAPCYQLLIGGACRIVSKTRIVQYKSFVINDLDHKVLRRRDLGDGLTHCCLLAYALHNAGFAIDGFWTTGGVSRGQRQPQGSALGLSAPAVGPGDGRLAGRERDKEISNENYYSF